MKFEDISGACPLAGHIVFQWIGAAYDARGMSKGREDTTWIPAAVSGGGLSNGAPLHGEIAESAVILGHIADLYPEAGLMGDGTSTGRAEVMTWLEFLSAKVPRAFQTIFLAPRFVGDATLAKALVDTARDRARQYLEKLDAQLEGEDWIAGTRSIADPYLFVVLQWAADADISLRGLQRLARFALRMEADDGVRAAMLPDEEAQG